ncbi:hypothetical protein HPP92_018634 [Vanilla planifolia]|uniref:Uncharacterized protein n=1 Tax=Vanilla planifolia TaxID=51239 RepID=A0A835QEG0_VANPL|nr:hypothetical protein HPP92_018634 [Vanilla planifolia]
MSINSNTLSEWKFLVPSSTLPKDVGKSIPKPILGWKALLNIIARIEDLFFVDDLAKNAINSHRFRRENWTIEPSEGFLEIDLWLKGHPIVTVVAVLTVSVDGSVSADDRIQSTIKEHE